MTVSGFSFIRNGTRFDYPFLESIQSVLPLCDEFVIAVGRSDDDTLEKIQSLRDSRIKIVETVWDETVRTGGSILAQQTDIALQHTNGDWAFYLQADEVIHEEDYPAIQNAIKKYCDDSAVEGLLFNFLHFYGSYKYVGNSRKWYRHEIRVIRNGVGVRSWRDAQGFRIDSRKMKVKPIQASIYHYGWVKPPSVQVEKQRHFNKLWHPDSWVSKHVQPGSDFEYTTGGILTKFAGTHPAVMKTRVASQRWTFEYDERKVQQSTKERVLHWIENKTGYRIGEYKNYELI